MCQKHIVKYLVMLEKLNSVHCNCIINIPSVGNCMEKYPVLLGCAHYWESVSIEIMSELY